MAETPPRDPQPPPSHGIIFDALAMALRWLDRPWKALALAGLAILVALGWSGWTSRDTITDIWRMSAGRPILKRSELPETLKHVRAETGADIVGYWSLNLAANSLVYEDAVGPYGKPWDFTPHRIPAIRYPVTEPRQLSDIMAGQIICREPGEPSADGDLVNRRMRADGIHQYCLIPVPPAPNILVGILLIAWVAEPDRSTKEAALGLARETAATMVSRWE